MTSDAGYGDIRYAKMQEGAVVTSQPSCNLRWNGPKLEQEWHVVQHKPEYKLTREWRELPQVSPDHYIVAEDADSVTVFIATGEDEPMFEDKNGNAVSAEEANRRVAEAEKELLDARDLPHNDDNGGFV